MTNINFSVYCTTDCCAINTIVMETDVLTVTKLLKDILECVAIICRLSGMHVVGILFISLLHFFTPSFHTATLRSFSLLPDSYFVI